MVPTYFRIKGSLTLALALACGGLGFLWPTWRAELQAQSSYIEGGHFLCYTTRATRGSICAEDAPVNAGGECESEPECGGDEEATSFCISNEFPKGFQVSLVDQFEDKDFDLKKPLNLCTPSDQNGAGIIDEETHLRGYRIEAVRKSCTADAPANPLGACENENECGGVEEETRFCDQTPRHVKQTNVRVDNQFGTLFVNTENPEHLLVPTAKDLLNPIEAPDPATHDVDHFKCYTVKVQRRMCEQEASLTCRRDADCGALGPCNMGFEREQQVTVANQFIEPAKLFDVREPTQLCTPVDKNGEGIKNAAAHLMCYKIKRAKGEPEHDKVPGIHVNNQFGPEQLDTKKEEELCVPSVKTVQ